MFLIKWLGSGQPAFWEKMSLDNKVLRIHALSPPQIPNNLLNTILYFLSFVSA